jgi:hypothetical protein
MDRIESLNRSIEDAEKVITTLETQEGVIEALKKAGKEPTIEAINEYRRIWIGIAKDLIGYLKAEIEIAEQELAAH